MTALTPGPSPDAAGEGRSYALPRMVRVEWKRTTRTERVQHAVGFLVSETETHLVLSDRFDGKHPDSRRLWTIDVGDVVTMVPLLRMTANRTVPPLELEED